MSSSTLRDLIARRVDRQWEAFAREHPHLAAAVDRVQLVEQTVANLQHDPRFGAAMRAADLDEDRLVRAAEALERLESAIALALPR